MADSINLIVQKEAHEQLDRLYSDLDKSHKKLLEFIQTTQNFNANFGNIKVPKDLEGQLNRTSKATRELNAQQKESKRLNNALATAQAKLDQAQSRTNQELQKARFETNLLNKEAREMAVLSSRLSSEYQKQSIRLNRLRRSYKDVALTQGENSREARQLLREITKLDSKLKRVDASVGQHQRSVGNYGKAWGNVGRIMRSVVAAFGLYSGIEIGRQIFNQIKEIDGLNKALIKVTESQELFNQATMFLSEVAYQGGLEINGLQKAYTKFYASAKTTNLTLQETQEIFKNVAIAGASMGLSTDDINGSMRALEQMLSKGNIQAEEIRGQLGERLPGAFQILAESMGLTTQELNKQLELGNVLAAEVLPNFAEQLKEAYDLDGDPIETLIASQNRLSNSWTAFVTTLSESDGTISVFFKGVIDLATDFLDKITMANKTIQEIKDEVSERSLSNAIKEDRKEVDALAESYLKNGVAVDELSAKIKAAQDLIKQYEKFGVGGWTGMLADLNENEYQPNIDALQQYIESLTEAEESTGELIKRKKQEALQLETGNKTMDATIQRYQMMVAELKNLQENTRNSTEEFEEMGRQIEMFETLIDQLRGAVGVEDLLKLTPEEQAEIDDFLNTEGIEKGMRALSITLKEEHDELMNEFVSAYEWDYQQFLKWSEQKILQSQKEKEEQRQQVTEWLNYSADAVSRVGDLYASFAERRINEYDKQMAASNEYYGNILANEQLTTEQRQLYEAQREQDRLRIEEKRREELQRAARAEKAFALFEIALNTASAVVAALPNIPLSTLIGSLGALQLAAVAARPIPQYKHGRKGGKAELAEVGDGGKREVITDRHGNLKNITPNKPTYTFLDEGDKVFPDIPSFADTLNYDDIMKASIMASLQGQSDKLSGADLSNVFDAQLAKMSASISEIKGEIRSGFKGAKIVNNNDNKGLVRELKMQRRRDV